MGGQLGGKGQGAVSSRGRRVAPVHQQDDDDDDDSDFEDNEDSEEDDSFRAGSGDKDGSEGSEGEEEDMEDDIDDEVIDKNEIAALGSNKLFDKKDRTRR